MSRTPKEKMIEKTVVLLAKKGLQGASFSEVLEASGAPRGSLYHHFPRGKDELVEAALGVASGQARAFLARSAGRPADEVAQAFVAMWRTLLTRSDLSAGCAVVAVTVAAPQGSPLQAATGMVFSSWRAELADLLVQGGVSRARAPSLAASLIAACEGAVILARAENSLEPFELVATEQIAAVKAAIAP